MRKHIAVLALGALALTLAGCGDSDKPSGGAFNTGPGDTGSGGGDSEISKLLAKTKAATYKVTYQSGDDDPFTVAQDPPRFAYSSGDSATYVTADGAAVSCSGSGSSETCTELPGSGDTYKTVLGTAFGAAGALFLSAAGTAIPGLADIKTSDGKVAGRDAVCATIDGGILGALGGEDVKGSYSVCVDQETGVMLELNSDNGAGSTTKITATNFGEPTDADFTPPVTPGTVPGQ